MEGEAEPNTTRGSVGGVVALVGGILAIVGSFLAWARLTAAGTSVAAKGIDGSDGRIALACGIVLLLYGIGGMTGIVVAGKRTFAILAVIAGLVALGLAVYDAATAKQRIVEDLAATVAGRVGVAEGQARRLLEAAVDSGQVRIRLGLGIFLVMAGGLMGLVGGIVGLSAAPAKVPPPVGGPAAPVPPQPSEPSG